MACYGPNLPLAYVSVFAYDLHICETGLVFLFRAYFFDILIFTA